MECNDFLINQLARGRSTENAHKLPLSAPSGRSFPFAIAESSQTLTARVSQKPVAASAKSTTALNYCGIDHNYIDYVVDSTKEKIGKSCVLLSSFLLNPSQLYLLRIETQSCLPTF